MQNAILEYYILPQSNWKSDRISNDFSFEIFKTLNVHSHSMRGKRKTVKERKLIFYGIEWAEITIQC